MRNKRTVVICTKMYYIGVIKIDEEKKFKNVHGIDCGESYW